jgi:predicted MFS family arabinose efflux permease
MINENFFRLRRIFVNYISIAVAFTIGILSVYTLPLLVTEVIAKYSISPAKAGVFAAAAALGRGMSAAIMSSRSRSLDLQRTALIGGGIIAVSNLGMVLTSSFEMVLFLRLVTGVGEGMALTAACIAAAAHVNPERAFGAAQITAGVAAIIVFLAVPPLKMFAGPDANFILLATIALLAVPGLACLERPRVVDEDKDHKYPNRNVAALVLVAFALFSLADIASWLFADEIGLRAGMDHGKVEAVLSATIGLALAGPALAMILDVRFGRSIPIIAGMTMLAIAVVLFTRASSEVGYIAAIIPLNFGFAFLTPYFMGTLAELDEGGSWTSLSNSVLAVVGIGGPLVAGLIADGGGYANLAWLTGPAIALGLFLLLIALRAPPLSNQPTKE